MIKTLGEYFGYDRLSFLSVLDIGSSTGIIDSILSTKFGKVIGSDIDEGAINYAKKTFQNNRLEFQIGDAMNLEFEDNSFDVVVCAQVYEHVSNQKKLFSEIYRVLKPGGVCYLAALNKLRIWEPHYNLPFLSWLPKKFANWYLRFSGKGQVYFETLRTYWDLQDMNKKFRVLDLTREIMINPKKYGYEDIIPSNPIFKLPLMVASSFYKFFSPTFFWLLVKPSKLVEKNLVDIDWTPTPTFLYRNYLYRKMASELPMKSSFLDIGCGNGVFLNYLMELGFAGEAIDISQEAIDFAKKQLKNPEAIKIKLIDLFKYKPAQKYDVVFCFETLEHIGKDKEAIKKIFNLLKPGGYFVSSVPAHKSGWSKLDELKGHYRRYEKKELKEKISSAGFRVQDVYSYGFPILSVLRKISSSGKLLRSKSKNQGKVKKTKESSIEQEYNPKLQFLAKNKFLMYPLFKIMDLFLKTDLGFGYLAVAQKPRR